MSDGRSKIELASYKGKRLNPAVKVLLALILLGALVFGGLLGLVLSGSHDAVQGNPQVMVVLGCQVKPWGPSVLLQDRLDKALEYLEDHPLTWSRRASPRSRSSRRPCPTTPFKT